MTNYSLIIFIIILLAIIAKFKTKNKKNSGIEGEKLVRKYLGKSIPNKRYVLNNVTIFINNISTQIDHILIEERGVFVIETKNHKGRIYGNEDSNNWTQVLAYGNSKHSLYNPIKQNETHINFLKEILKRDDIFYSIIIFTQAELHTNTKSSVGNISIIKEVVENSETRLSIVEIEDIYAKLKKYKENSINLEEKHIQNLKERDSLRNSNMCPNCKVKLVKRSGKYGNFYSCPNFPRCSYSKAK